MKRRRFLSLVGALAGGGVLLGPDLVLALLRCQDYPQYSTRQCEAGIDSSVLDVTAAAVGGQHMEQWCWAACIEMVFHYYGFVVPQERLVRETWGEIYNQPADPATILANLNRAWVDDRGRGFTAVGDVFTANVVTAAQDLSENMPLIIGTMGHAMVLTSMLYYCSGWTGFGWTTCGLNSAVVRDPWPGRGRRQLTPQEWMATSFLARIRVQGT
ncbi:MAG: papain-like cysteine protease family protein [Thermodesulfobacteriota bacterium]